MRFYKVAENDVILFIGKGNGGEEITEAEYEAIKADAIAYAAANPPPENDEITGEETVAQNERSEADASQ